MTTEKNNKSFNRPLYLIPENNDNIIIGLPPEYTSLWLKIDELHIEINKARLVSKDVYQFFKQFDKLFICAKDKDDIIFERKKE